MSQLIVSRRPQKNITMLFDPILKIITKDKLDAYLKGEHSEIEKIANSIVNSTPAFRNVTLSNANGNSITYPNKIRPQDYNVLTRPWYPKATEKKPRHVFCSLRLQ
ncbi:Uncharacterised protein [Kluyvera cryocrescens]|uniref:Uncharacterized protein n=1 Tax=Kluyvera cryocrescens TaxID=580 RepID=A0A485A9B8_KLUCR|nr:Uncharacterised protein [Kluyvera cryocrescens]